NIIGNNTGHNDTASVSGTNCAPTKKSKGVRLAEIRPATLTPSSAALFTCSLLVAPTPASRRHFPCAPALAIIDEPPCFLVSALGAIFLTITACRLASEMLLRLL